MVIRDRHLSLRGYKYNILGRSVVVHEDPDDLGKGGNAESKKTGNEKKKNKTIIYIYEKVSFKT